MIAEFATEAEQVEHWRLCELIRAGYPIGLAAKIAPRTDIDLHHACELVESGCPAETAGEILL